MPSGCSKPQISLNPADGHVTINSAVTISSAGGGASQILDINPVDHRIDVGGEIWSTKSINTSDDITAEGNISACGNITACGDIAALNITGGSIYSRGTLNVDAYINAGSLSVSDGITLSGETITSWAELKGPSGPSIQRFTSPELPANCSQFYFEGCKLVTGKELPFIQVRETATGKLVQMDVWVNLDGCCSGFTLGKPVANVEPCSSAIEAGTWTAIVMN